MDISAFRALSVDVPMASYGGKRLYHKELQNPRKYVQVWNLRPQKTTGAQMWMRVCQYESTLHFTLDMIPMQLGLLESRRGWPIITAIQVSVWAQRMVEKGHKREKCNSRKSYEMTEFFLSTQRRHSSCCEESTGTVAPASNGLHLDSELGFPGTTCQARTRLTSTHGDDKILTQLRPSNSTYTAGARWAQFYNVWLSQRGVQRRLTGRVTETTDRIRQV